VSATGGAAPTGWTDSAQAWIDDLAGEHEFGRRHVLDPVMLARVRGRGFSRALDVGCGEGRFCRMMAAEGIAATGIDPTEPLLAEARARDPGGDYRIGRAERLDFDDDGFDLVVSYLSLIDIADIRAAIGEMARVLRPGGSLLIANLNPFNTAAIVGGGAAPDQRNAIRGYLNERSGWVAWRGIRIRNWHRPMTTYMALLLGAGLELRFFVEPAASGGPSAQQQRYDDAPWFHVMEWRKPAD